MALVTTAAAKERMRQVGAGLLANMMCNNSRNIKQAFYDTGIYPISFDRFSVNSKTVLDADNDLINDAKERISIQENQKRQRLEAAPRINVYDDLLIVSGEAAL